MSEHGESGSEKKMPSIVVGAPLAQRLGNQRIATAIVTETIQANVVARVECAISLGTGCAYNGMSRADAHDLERAQAMFARIEVAPNLAWHNLGYLPGRHQLLPFRDTSCFYGVLRASKL